MYLLNKTNLPGGSSSVVKVIKVIDGGSQGIKVSETQFYDFVLFVLLKLHNCKFFSSYYCKKNVF